MWGTETMHNDYAGYNKYMVTTQDTEIYMESQDSLLVEHLTCEQKVVNSVCSRSRGRIFFSIPPYVTAVAHKRTWSFCQKCS